MNSLKEKLNAVHSWPCEYKFKFVVANETAIKQQLISTLGDLPVSEKLSKTEKYTSITATKHCQDADEVVEVYQSVQKIQGIIAL